MSLNYTSSIVRIFHFDGTVAGGGCLVDNQHVITCLHVVTQVLGVPEQSINLAQPELGLDFPLIAPRRTLNATIINWDLEKDVAILKLTGSLPSGASPARLVTSEELWGHRFRVFGFPAGYDDGVWASGMLRSEQAAGWIQIEDVKESGYRVELGFSGSPVWDERLKGIVGITVAADARSGIKTAFIIPTRSLILVLPGLASVVQVYADSAAEQLSIYMEQLRASRDNADLARRGTSKSQRVVNVRPLDVTHSFKDRLQETRLLCDYLASSSIRLISVVGRSGMGKTALASYVLGDLETSQSLITSTAGEFCVNGIIYLSRNTELRLDRIYADIGRMLGEPLAGELKVCWASEDMSLPAKIENLLEILRDGLYLILLDNFEDTLADDGTIRDAELRLFVEKCLTQPSGVRLIITSREDVKLDASMRHSYRYIALRDGLPELEAIELLRDLDPQNTLGLRDASESELRRAVQLTQGIPRALEIFVGILDQDRTLTLPKLLAEGVTFGAEIIAELLTKSYQHLATEDQRVMEALAVFDRPTSDIAVTYLLYPWFPALNAKEVLSRLSRSYFVANNRITGEFSLHPLDREFAYQQIPDVDEPENYVRRNLELRAADFYSNLGKPKVDWKSIVDLAPQLNEIQHRFNAGDYDNAARLLDQIDFDYLLLWGHFQLVARFRQKLVDKLTDPALRAYSLGSLGHVCQKMGEYELSVQYLSRALALLDVLRDKSRQGRWLTDLGHASLNLGSIEQALNYYQQSLRFAQSSKDRLEEGRGYANLAHLFNRRGEYEKALGYLQQALRISQDIGDKRGEGNRLNSIAVAYKGLHRMEEAIAHFKMALLAAQEINNKRLERMCYGNLGWAYWELNLDSDALIHFEQGLAIASQIGDQSGIVSCVDGIAMTYWHMGLSDQAVEHELKALEIAERIHNREKIGIALNNLGMIYQSLGSSDLALKYFESSLEIARELGNQDRLKNRLENLTNIKMDPRIST